MVVLVKTLSAPHGALVALACALLLTGCTDEGATWEQMTEDHMNTTLPADSREVSSYSDPDGSGQVDNDGRPVRGRVLERAGDGDGLFQDLQVEADATGWVLVTPVTLDGDAYVALYEKPGEDVEPVDLSLTWERGDSVTLLLMSSD